MVKVAVSASKETTCSPCGTASRSAQQASSICQDVSYAIFFGIQMFIGWLEPRTTSLSLASPGLIDGTQSKTICTAHAYIYNNFM